jgi:ElaB/YqjD/DUF883 family membrane-anchored ribosome-binding protein
MRHNGDRRPEEIEAEIARTRGDMDATLTAIEQRLTPGQLVDQGIDYLRNSGANEFVHNLGGSVKNNPLPVALMGIGIAWLMATGNRKPSYASPPAESSAPGMAQRAAQRLSSAKDSLSSAKDSLSSAKNSLFQTTERVRGQAQRVRSGYDTMVREQPLALGAFGLAVGACLAAIAPRTSQEDQLMGEASDRMAGQAKALGKESLEKARQQLDSLKEPPPERPAPLGGGVTPKDPRLGTP